MRYFLLLVVPVILFSACSIQKRMYRDGFYISNRNYQSETHSQSNNQEDLIASENSFVSETEFQVDESMDSIPFKPNESGVVEQPEDSTRRKWFKKADRDTVPVEEEPARIETPSKRWRFAADAVLAPFLGITLGFILFIFTTNELLIMVLSSLVILISLVYIFLSVRAHYRYKKQEGAAGGQTVWGIVGRFLLYAIALLGVAVIFNASFLWST